MSSVPGHLQRNSMHLHMGFTTEVPQPQSHHRKQLGCPSLLCGSDLSPFKVQYWGHGDQLALERGDSAPLVGSHVPHGFTTVSLADCPD